MSIDIGKTHARLRTSLRSQMHFEATTATMLEAESCGRSFTFDEGQDNTRTNYSMKCTLVHNAESRLHRCNTNGSLVIQK